MLLVLPLFGLFTRFAFAAVNEAGDRRTVLQDRHCQNSGNNNRNKRFQYALQS